MADHSETVTRLRRLLLDPLVAAVVYLALVEAIRRRWAGGWGGWSGYWHRA